MTNLMIVDDYEIFRRQLKRQKCLAEDEEFHIMAEADNGLEALEFMRENKVDILLTDIKMPRLGGLELLEHVRKENLCGCVVLLSEYADFEYARKGIVLGAFDYIVKPVKDASLKKVLRRAVRCATGIAEENQSVPEIKAVVDCIINSGNNFDKLVAALQQRCITAGEDDPMKDSIELVEAAKAVYTAVSGKYEWISLVTMDSDEISRRIIQADGRYMSAAVFQEYLMEMYGAVRMYYPPGMSELSEKTVTYILNHPFEKITLTDIAEVCYVSNAYLSHSFKQEMGKSFVDYVMTLKMSIVKKMLSAAEMSITSIAERLGYDDYKYMGRIFKNMYGFSPSDYRKMQTEK